MLSTLKLQLLLCFVVLASGGNKEQFPKLQQYNLDRNSITISGISSGGGFVTQYHFSFSSLIKGTGVLEAAAYPCYLVTDQTNNCLNSPNKTNINRLIEVSNGLAKKGLIDPLGYMNGTKVYVFHGKNDSTVNYFASYNIVDMYKKLGAEVYAKLDLNAEHGQPVDGNGYGGPCAKVNPPYYINECGYNSAYDMMNFFYGGNLIKPNGSFKADGRLDNFDQMEFSAYDPLSVTMAKMGFVYVPKNCQDGTRTCRFHIAFHGCSSNYDKVGYSYALKTQYAEVAELNDIVILFPQSGVTVLNSKGCWDVVGFSGRPDYATKIGKQVAAVYNMMNRMLGL